MEYSILILYFIIGFIIAVLKVRYDPYCDELEGVVVVLMWPATILAALLWLFKPRRFR